MALQVIREDLGSSGHIGRLVDPAVSKLLKQEREMKDLRAQNLYLISEYQKLERKVALQPHKWRITIGWISVGTFIGFILGVYFGP